LSQSLGNESQEMLCHNENDKEGRIQGTKCKDYEMYYRVSCANAKEERKVEMETMCRSMTPKMRLQ